MQFKWKKNNLDGIIEYVLLLNNREIATILRNIYNRKEVRYSAHNFNNELLCYRQYLKDAKQVVIEDVEKWLNIKIKV